MKELHLILISVLLAASASTAWAASNTNKGSTPNGKPFVEIQGQIIEVEGEVATLQDQVDALVGTVDSIEARVTANEDAITSLQATSATLQAQITANAADITSLTMQVDDLETANAGLQTQIDTLGDTDGALQAQIDANSSLITTLNLSIADLGVTLQDQIDHNAGLIALMQDEVDQINASLDMKQMIVSGSCLPDQSIQQIQADGSVVCSVNNGGGTGSVTELRVYSYSNCNNSYGCSTRSFCPVGSTLTGGGAYGYTGSGGTLMSYPTAWTTADLAYYNTYYPGYGYGRSWDAYMRNNYYNYNYVYSIAMCLQFN